MKTLYSRTHATQLKLCSEEILCLSTLINKKRIKTKERLNSPPPQKNRINRRKIQGINNDTTTNDYLAEKIMEFMLECVRSPAFFHILLGKVI